MIVDTNIAVIALVPPVAADFLPLSAAINKGLATIVVGGKLRKEYLRVTALVMLVQEYQRTGRARVLPDTPIDEIARTVAASGHCTSDDPHVIALARVSGARLLCTRDAALSTDFKNRKLLTPRGSIYRNADHRHLLRKHCPPR